MILLCALCLSPPPFNHDDAQATLSGCMFNSGMCFLRLALHLAAFLTFILITKKLLLVPFAQIRIPNMGRNVFTSILKHQYHALIW